MVVHCQKCLSFSPVGCALLKMLRIFPEGYALQFFLFISLDGCALLKMSRIYTNGCELINTFYRLIFNFLRFI